MIDFTLSDLSSPLFFFLKLSLLIGFAVGIIEVVLQRKNPSFTDRDKVDCICCNLFDSLKRYFMALLSAAGITYIVSFTRLLDKPLKYIISLNANFTGQTFEEFSSEAESILTNPVDWLNVVCIGWIAFAAITVAIATCLKLFSASCFAPPENMKKKKKKAEPTRAIKVTKKTWIVAKNLIKYMVWSGGFVFFYFLSDFFFGNLQQIVVDISVLQDYINHLQLVWVCLLVYGGFIMLKRPFDGKKDASL